VHKLDWHHLFVDKGGNNQVIRDYKIQTFPTTILIDKNGKIVARYRGTKGLKEILRYLETHVN
jgi:cytochrome oxidase Cu insertion factor (SCO1/SenC/PrrC family)